MEIVNPFEYINKYIPENPTQEDYEKVPSKESLNIYPLPSYEFIDHKYIMSEFTHNIYDNKEARKELFYTLRFDDYMDKFYDCLKNMIYIKCTILMPLIIMALYLERGVKNIILKLENKLII